MKEKLILRLNFKNYKINIMNMKLSNWLENSLIFFFFNIKQLKSNWNSNLISMKNNLDFKSKYIQWWIN